MELEAQRERMPLMTANEVTPLRNVKPSPPNHSQMNPAKDMDVYKEMPAFVYPAQPVLIIFALLTLLSLAGWIIGGAVKDELVEAILFVLAGLGHCVVFFMMFGLFVVQPNEAKVLQLCGAYKGSCREPGLKWTWPFYSVHTVSLRMRNFETDRLKVNDVRGNPIELGGVVVWAVDDTAQAMFHVNDYVTFVKTQSESAFRNLAARFPFDNYDGELSLLGHTQEICGELKLEIQARLGLAGIAVCEAQITRLAYSSEIAGAMLQRQQATAIVAARQQIVQGAVGMVDEAIKMIKANDICEFTDEKKADTVSGLLLVLCGDKQAQPTLNLN